VQSFTAHMALLTATSAFGLGTRCWSSPQQCYLHCLCTFKSQLVNQKRMRPACGIAQMESVGSFLQYFHTAGWVTARAPGLKNSCNYHKKFYFGGKAQCEVTKTRKNSTARQSENASSSMPGHMQGAK